MGVANLVDDLRPALPAAARVVAALDAGFALDYPPYDAATQTESTETPSPVDRAVEAATQAWGGRGDADCDAAATDPLARARCYLPSRTFPSGAVGGPMFVRQSQRDPVQLKQLGARPTETGPIGAYRGRFAAAMA